VWLYTALNNNNPGIVVPPPPEKQQLGRFQDEFVEARRSALERMLNKIAQHTLLQRDIDFKLFIESDAFNTDVKQREKANSISESKGFMGSIGLGSSTFSGKIPEQDEVSPSRLDLHSGLKIARHISTLLKLNSRHGQRLLSLS
jgi:sorting nexin-1/2